MKKQTYFKIILFFLPLIFLLILEGALHLVNYGQDFSLFVQDKDHPDCIHLNSKVSLRYFLKEENVTTGNTELFLKNKPKDLKRIFIQGESTALGFPYFHNGSFPRMLEYQLRNDIPDMNLEVINLSMTAINSYAIYDFADEIIAQRPDAIIINAGQNEYYGALGVGSTGTFGSNVTINRLGIWVRKTKVGQLCSKIINSLSTESPTKDYDKTLMERMVKTQEIPYNSKAYYAGINQYYQNLDETLAKYHKAGIKVFLTNPISNLKDLKPFISLKRSQYNAIQHFELAEKYYQKGNYQKAKEEYIKAKEYDALRFRAPEAIEKVINQLARKYDNVVLVDIKKALENHTKNHIIGKELMLEHVHPNLTGHFLIEQALDNCFRKSAFLYRNGTTYKPLLNLNEIPVNQVDSLTGIYSTWLLREGWPFNEPLPKEEKKDKTLEEALAGGISVHTITWNEAMYKLMSSYLEQENFSNAIKVGESFVLEYPYEYAFFELTVNMCIDAREYDKGIRYAKRAEMLKSNPDILKKLLILYLKQDQPEKALPYIEKLILGGSSVDYRPMQEAIKQIIIYENSLTSQTADKVKLKGKIYDLYRMIGNVEAAERYRN